MSQTLSSALAMAGTRIVASLLLVQSAKEKAERKRDDSYQPQTVSSACYSAAIWYCALRANSTASCCASDNCWSLDNNR